MKRTGYLLLTFAAVLFAANIFVLQVFAADLVPEQAAVYQNLTNGVAVMDDGTICAANGSSIRVFKDGGTNAYSINLPAKCGNVCSYGDYLFAAGYMSGHMNEIYVLKPGDWASCKTLDAGQRVQAVDVDYDGYLYCINSTGTRSNGKKATKILRKKISDVVSLSSGDTITWSKEYQPDYVPPSSDGNCYPQGIAIDGKGIIYIADKGSSNGYDASVDGIYKYDPKADSVVPMYFTSGSSHLLFTWIYDICADDYGTVAVAGRNTNKIAIFKNGSTSADAIVGANGFPEGVGMDKEGNIYYNASNNSDTAKNGIYKIEMNNVAVSGINISSSAKAISIGKSFTLSSSVSPSDATNKDVMFSSSDTTVASVDKAGKVTGKKAGKAFITIKTVQGRKTASCEVTVSKVANPLAMKSKTASVKYSKLKKKTQTLALSKVIKFTKQIDDKKTYTLSSVKKGTKSFKKSFKINKTTGKVTVKKGLKKGTYKVKVKVKALGNSKYKASTLKSVTFKVKVK